MNDEAETAPPGEPASMAEALPLAGIRVIEFSHMVMGPTCGLILADLGADVIKIEPGPTGDNTRRLPGSGAGFFVTYNRNKRSAMLDLKSPQGYLAARKLIGTADVVIENFRTGALDKIGLGFDTLAAENERLIYCSMKGFLTGPYEGRPALDEIVQMMGGLAYMTGPTGRPLRAGASVNDVMGGMFAAIAVLAAILKREKTGKGELVRSSLFENNVFLVAQHMTQLAVTGKPAAPLAERLSAWAIYELFTTKDDKQIFVGVVSDTQWKAFCEAFDLPELKADPALGSNFERANNRPKFIETVKNVFRQMNLAEALAKCEAVGLPFAPVNKPEDLFDDPHLNHGGGMVEVTIPHGAKTKLAVLPMEFSGRRLPLRRDIPRAGEHSADVLREIGYDEETLAAMLESGALVGEAADGAKT